MRWRGPGVHGGARREGGTPKATPYCEGIMKVLIADKFQPSGIAALKELGCDVVSQPDASAETMADLVGSVDPDVLVVRGAKVSGKTIAAGKRLSLIIRAGAGFDTIDLGEASRRGI